MSLGGRRDLRIDRRKICSYMLDLEMTGSLLTNGEIGEQIKLRKYLLEELWLKKVPNRNWRASRRRIKR
jgi:hypothetical protein